jgi:DNA-binding response OmpR family regulator
MNTVCLIDDENFILKMYSLAFKQAGFRVIAAETYQDILPKIKKEAVPDIILLDVLMPDCDGFDALKKFKKDKQLKDVPVIMLTNLSSHADRKAAERLGALII